jgi:hypothetical protein
VDLILDRSLLFIRNSFSFLKSHKMDLKLSLVLKDGGHCSVVNSSFTVLFYFDDLLFVRHLSHLAIYEDW